MKIWMRLRGSILAILVLLILAGSFGLFARSAANEEGLAKKREQLLGTWLLVSAKNDKNVDILGSEPLGMLVFDSNGNYTTQVMRSDLPKFASPDRTKATPEESQAAIRGSMALFGKFEVSDERTITLHIVGSLFPNWNGADQKRLFTVKGDELELTNLTNSFGAAATHVRWKRVSGNR